MTFQSRFLLGLGWRVAILLVAVFTFVRALGADGLVAARIVSGLLVLAAAGWLWHYIQRTNVELSRFIEAVGSGDFSQRFGGRLADSGFSELSGALNAALTKLRHVMHQMADANRFCEAVLDDAPTAMLTVDCEGRVELANKAARRLLNRHQGVRVKDFRVYSQAFSEALVGDTVDMPRLVSLIIEGVAQTALVSAAIVHRLESQVRVISIQPIQSELDATEIAAQQDLIRVLTHEIMNSMTPVTSLAHSAAVLMRHIGDRAEPAIADAQRTVEILARRADGVMQFVSSYRQISRTPEMRVSIFSAEPWAREIEALFLAACEDRVELHVKVDPPTLRLEADADLLAQVLLNLLKNGAEAARAIGINPSLHLSVTRTRTGRAQIEVADNGAGVPDKIRHDIFLPFFTTKRGGIGVGLSLARQVVLAHQGVIDVDRTMRGGAVFRILLPD